MSNLREKKPDMLDECKCGHPFEEHDWGAWKKKEADCLVEDCACTKFKVNNECLREKIIEICLLGWDEEVCKCEECLGRANKRADQILSLFREEIEGAKNPFVGYIDVIENIRMAKEQGFERFRQVMLEKIKEVK